jgi:hypothetical protein
VLLVLIGTVLGGNTGTDPAQKHVWGENVGWANAGPTNYEVTVHYYEGTNGWLSGYAWGENVGWIVIGSAGGGPYANTNSSNWGVNMDSAGDLSGYAWGENIGWIKFASGYNTVSIAPANGAFSGYAWGENVGWLKFSGTSPDYGVRTLAFDTQARGTPNWWLDYHGVTEGYDAGDGVPAWQKYVMDADPNDTNNYLRIMVVSNAPSANVVAFTPASPQRYYTLTRRGDLTAGGWSNVAGQVAMQYDTSGQKTMQDTNVVARMFYRVNVMVTP